MIEVYSLTKKREKKGNQRLEGYINENQILNNKKKLKGFTEGNVFYYGQTKSQTALILRDDNVITYEDGEELGYIKDFKIYGLNDQLYVDFSKENGKILLSGADYWFQFKGNLDRLNEITFISACSLFFDLFC